MLGTGRRENRSTELVCEPASLFSETRIASGRTWASVLRFWRNCLHYRRLLSRFVRQGAFVPYGAPSIKEGGGGLSRCPVLRTPSCVVTCLLPTRSYCRARRVSDQARLVDNEICQGIPSRRPRGSKRIRVHAAAGNTTETYSVSSHGEFSIHSTEQPLFRRCQ